MLPYQMAAQAAAQAEASVGFYCRPCKMVFGNEGLLQAHKISSENHIMCDVCAMEFRDEEAKKSHRTAHHPEEQNLTCEYCGEHFNRVGGLVGHWEFTECRGLPADVFEKQRKKAMEILDMARAAHRFQDVRRTGPVHDEPLPPIGAYARIPVFQKTPVGQRVDQGSSQTPTGDVAGNGYDMSNHGSVNNSLFDTGALNINADEDLISFTTSAVLNTPWGADPNEALLNMQKLDPADFPALGKPAAASNHGPHGPSAKAYVSTQTQAGSMAARAGGQPAGGQPAVTPASAPNAWRGRQNLFPNAPAAKKPPAAMLKSMYVPKSAKANETDPDSPDFRAAKYWIPALGKFKCPHCLKSFAANKSFTAHLKSPAHHSENLQCSTCLRYFDTATALTQHYESQGVHCTVRETDGYDSVLLSATAMKIKTQGRLADDTIKYATNSAAPIIAGDDAGRVGAGGIGASRVVAAHRAAEKALNEERNTFWDRHTPKW